MEHICMVCFSPAPSHPEKCDCGCGDAFLLPLCCEGCGCLSFETAHGLVAARPSRPVLANGRRPAARSRYHVLDPVTERPVCGSFPLGIFVDAREVRTWWRCARKACADRFAAADARPMPVIETFEEPA